MHVEPFAVGIDEISHGVLATVRIGDAPGRLGLDSDDAQVAIECRSMPDFEQQRRNVRAMIRD